MTPIRHFAALCLLLSIAACNPLRMTHITGAPLPHNLNEAYTYAAPHDWVKYELTSNPNFVSFTRDGQRVNHIISTVRPVAEAYEKTGKGVDPKALPTEWADGFMAEFHVVNKELTTEIVSNTPTRVDGLPAFSLVFDYKTKKGLPIRNKMIGFISAKGFVVVRFEAPNLIYYERDLPAFEQMLASIKIKK